MSKYSPYLIAFFFILFWWYCAFFNEKPKHSIHQFSENTTGASALESHYSRYLSSFSKKQIHQALSGDAALMAKLMKEWDIDARILENFGIEKIQKLNRSSFLKAQMISRELQDHNHNEANYLIEQDKNHIVYDDQGVPFPVNNQFKRYLPQTFVAASFLFALTSPDQIVAIPNGLRAQTALYPVELTCQIPLNTDRINSEHLYKKEPHIAFVADYSHPAALEMMRNQGIPLFTLNGMKTIRQIKDAIKRIGNVINCTLKAEMLALFIESAMIAIDNRLAAFKHELSRRQYHPKIMFLNHFSQFSVPTNRTITGSLLHRLEWLEFNITPKQPQNAKQWFISIDQENIIDGNPDFLIVATHDQEGLLKQMINHPAFVDLSACRHQQIHTVDNTAHAPTQFIVLAYFDIADALLKSNLGKISGYNHETNSLCASD